MAAIAAAAAKEIYKIARRAQTEDIDGWFERAVDQILELLAAFFETLRRLTSAFLEEHSSLNGVVVEPAIPDWLNEPARESLRITGPVAFKQNMEKTGDPVVARETMAKRMSGAAQRIAMDGQRRTVEETVERSDEIVGWRRVSDGNPCAWCAMLIGRGAVYKSRRSATSVVGRRGVARGTGPQARAIGQSYHDNDGCTAVPLYVDEEEPEDVDRLYDEWHSATAGLSGREALNAWRRYWEGKQSKG